MSKDVVNWEEQFATEAKEVAALERPAIGNIGFRGGVLTYGGAEIEGGEITGIPLAYTMEHTFYPDKWDPDDPQPPTCFAQALPTDAGRDGNLMVPHESVVAPVNPTCDGCSNLKWGSAEGSAGKACKQIRKIAFIPWTEDLTAEQIAAAEIGVAKIPVTSVKNWKKYINAISAKYSRPPWAVVATMTVKNHAKYQFTVNFADNFAISDNEMLAALNARIADVQTLLLTPYTYEEEAEEEAPKSKARKKY